jgi:hypothetical protein
MLLGWCDDVIHFAPTCTIVQTQSLAIQTQSLAIQT